MTIQAQDIRLDIGLVENGKMIKLKSLLNENIRTNSMVKIIRIFKKLGIVVKKSTPIKKGFMNSKSDFGFFITVYDRKTKQEAVLPLEVRDGYLYYEIEKTHRLGKWPEDLKDTSAMNKIVNTFKPFTKYEAFGQGGLIKK